ncbi:hypothetical protein GGR55DRAFT_698736 [Xylaria sp. FL0064]|nr:hypothetical protein GGR55DRAFT_698736 [Xylaria sp. FL0064]
MESKRKASGANGLETATDTDRAAKRRKLIEEYGDLADGETSESTTAYGLSILESIRATTDKKYWAKINNVLLYSGRAVAPYFETLPSRSENPQYYKKIRLPLSLEVIERKLKEQQYPTLSTLESDFKRLVSNAKETNDRSSTVFGDAERVRKAVSNLMVKHNPAYKAGNYQAVPTPLPPTPEPEGDDEEEANGEADEETGTQPAGKGEQHDVDDVDAEGEDEKDEDGENDGDEGKANEDDQEEDNDEDPQPRRRRGSSWRKSDPRPSRDSATPGQKSIPRTGKADHYYEGIPFSELNFQQAQEKVIEELIRKKEDPDDYPYFEPFIYLPPRTLRDYYEVIAEPLSLKALQKQVRGQHGRSEATWVSDFKSWAAFEDQASLIWKNAYHYNEDGSEIFTMAQELEETFHELLKEAKASVPEPPQPKIKLKVPQQAPETPGHPKKITIHVGGKSSATGSPAPATAQSGESEATRNGTPVNRNPFGGASSAGTSVSLNQLDKARSMSASIGPPSPSVIGVTKTEDAVQSTPIARPQATPTTFQHFVPVVVNTSTPTPNGTTPQYQPPPPPPPPPPKKSATDILEAQKYRPQPIRETDALMPRLVISTHPSAQIENKLVMTFPASMTEYQQEIVVNVPLNQFRLQFKPQVASFLEPEQREWKLNVIHDTTRLFPSSVSFDKRGEPVFDVTLRYGINRVEVTLVAALPKGETAPNGLNMEMERFVLHMNLLKH